MKVPWTIVWVVTWAAWAAAAPTKIGGPYAAGLSSLSGVSLGFPSSASSLANPVLGVAQAGVPFDISPVDLTKRSVQGSAALDVSLPSPNPSLAPPAYFVRELEALEDLIQSGSLSGGVPLSIASTGTYQGDVGGAGGQQGISGSFQSSVGIPLQVTEIGSDFISGNPQFLSGDILNINSGSLQGLQGVSLGGGGGLQGDYGSLNIPGIDFRAGSVEGRQLDPATFVTTDLLGTTGGLQATSGSFGGAFLGSSGLDGLQLNSGGFQALPSDSFGVALPPGNTEVLPSGSGGLQDGSFGVSLPLENTGVLQNESGGFEGLQSGTGGLEVLQGGSGILEELQNESEEFEDLQIGAGGFGGLQSGSFGVPLPLANNGGLANEAIGVDGLQGDSFGTSLLLGNTGDLQLESVSLGNLQRSLGNLELNTAGLEATQLGSQGLDGLSLQAAGLNGVGVGVSSTSGPGGSTDVLLGSSVSDGPLIDLGNVGVSLAEAVQTDQFSTQPTDVPGTFTASSFDTASLDSLGELLNDNAEGMTNPTQSLGSFLMDLNGKNGMMVLPASNLDALQSGQLSIAAAANASLQTVFDADAEGKEGGLFDLGIDLTTQSDSNFEVLPSLATLFASTTGIDNIVADTENTLFVSLAGGNGSSTASASSTTATTPATTTTTTTEGPPRLASILPNLLFSKGQFFGTLLGGLSEIGSTIIKVITETDWTVPPTRSYSDWA